MEFDDATRVPQSASDEYAIHQFKNYVGDVNAVTLYCDCQTDLAPSISTVYLQIYNINTLIWDTVDSDNTSNADTDFVLTAIVIPLTDYKDASSTITCRVWQLAQ